MRGSTYICDPTPNSLAGRLHVPGRSRRWAACWAGLAGLLVGLEAGVAAADGILLDSLGARAAGRAGTTVAVADGPSAMFRNPAALSRLPSAALEVSSDAYALDVSYRDADDRGETTSARRVLPTFALTSGPEGRWRFAVGAFSPGGFGTSYTLNSPEIGQRDYASELALAKLTTSAAFELTEELSLGVTVGVNYTRLALDTPYFLQTGDFAGTPTVIDFEADAYSPTWSLGMLYTTGEPGSELSFGLAYTEQIDATLEDRARVQVIPGGTTLDTSLDLRTHVRLPRSLALGIAKQLGPEHRIALDVELVDWSGAFGSIPIDLDRASSPLLAGVSVNDRLTLDWRDTVSVRVGYERRLSSAWLLRLGYIHHESPVREQRATPLVPAVFEHVYAAGLSRRAGNVELNLALQLGLGPSQRVDGSRLVGGEFDRSRTRGTAVSAFVGFTYWLD